jgi:vanillate O-demethylase monooxygenase subunit
MMTSQRANTTDPAAASREQAYLESWRSFYHPVATVAELNAVGTNAYGQQKVLGKELLGQRIVVAELEGRVVALNGTCPHRSASLALGWVNEEETAVTCPYHGFQWAADGRIHRIPAIEAEGHHLPAGKQWCVQAYPTQVKYGLIWVSLVPDPRFPLLDVPEADDPFYERLPISEQTWQAGVGRIIEASLDTYHFAFTHQGTIGDPAHPEAPKTDVVIDDDCFYIEYDIRQPDNPTVSYGKAASNDDRAPASVVSHYQFWATPNAVHLRKSSEKAHFGVLAAVCAVRPQLSKFYRILYKGRGMKVSAGDFMTTQDRINKEDQIVVESMQPWELTTDLDAELQVYVDRPTVAYRRWLADMGLQFL